MEAKEWTIGELHNLKKKKMFVLTDYLHLKRGFLEKRRFFFQNIQILTGTVIGILMEQPHEILHFSLEEEDLHFR